MRLHLRFPTPFRQRPLAAFAAAALLLAALLGFAMPARAHDTWVMPASFRVPVGQAIATTLSAGDGLAAAAGPGRQGFRELHLVDSRGRAGPIFWRDGRDAARALFAAGAPGVACLALTTHESDIAIEPEIVDKYLREVHAPAQIVDAWQAQRARGEGWRERYAKDGKTYLRSGDASSGWPALARLGQRLEMVPQSDPTRLEIGDTLTVQLQFDGRPAPGMPLRLYAGSATEQVVHTDAQGRAQFTLAQAGPHLLATTLITPPAGAGAPWTSRFATLGFGVGASPL